jgi:hypothetical protein
MEPRKPKPHKSTVDAEPPLEVEGGETDEATPGPAASDPTGGMIGEGGRSGGGSPAESDREGGMIGEG